MGKLLKRAAIFFVLLVESRAVAIQLFRPGLLTDMSVAFPLYAWAWFWFCWLPIALLSLALAFHARALILRYHQRQKLILRHLG